MTGLTTAEVDQRQAAGQHNTVPTGSSRSIKDIIRANTFTLFNLILAIALALVLLTGRWPDAVFGFVVIINAGIGIITELRAKRVLDKLAILQAPTAKVLRDGVEQHVPLPDLVLDDIVKLATGDQIPADGTIVTSAGMEVDESLLTGESRPVLKHEDDEVLSGSFVVAGTATAQLTRVGEHGYANKLTAQAKRYSLVQSDLRDGVNRVLRLVSVLIIPIALLLAWSQLQATGGISAAMTDGNWKQAIVSAVAGIIGMIPEGLVLLTSINFAVAAMILARKKVLVQELPAVELLARVNTFCLDKTGTITDGSIHLTELIELAPHHGAQAALAALTDDPDANATSAAIRAGLDVDPEQVAASVPFSSARKWAAVTTAGGTWVLGAPEVVLAGRDDDAARSALDQAGRAARTGARVVLLAHKDQAPGDCEQPQLPRGLGPVLLAVLGESVRPGAEQTIAYFRQQGVGTKIISGDSTDTVLAIAQTIRVAGDTEPTGCSGVDLPDDDAELAQYVDRHDVFGRVTPEQKVRIVAALQARGHVVAMTGDGVNDATALKQADLGIAMGSGSAATKAVARIVLADGRFETLPGVVAQGRRVMANMERVATLFLSKTTYSALLAVVVVILAWPYPLLPRHMTLVGALTIGIPAFALALAPNPRRYRPGFLRRALAFAVPVGIVTGTAALITFAVLLSRHPLDDARAGVTLVFITIGLWVVGIVARPLQPWKVALIAVLAATGVAAFLTPTVGAVFMLDTGNLTPWIVVGVVLGWVAIEIVWLFITPRLLRSERDRDPEGARTQLS